MSSHERLTAVSSAHLLLIDQNEVLLFRSRTDGYMGERGYFIMPPRDTFLRAFQLPVGTFGIGSEQPEDAIVRKTHEEIGLKIDQSELVHVHTNFHPASGKSSEGVDEFYAAFACDGEVTISPADKYDEVVWTPVTKMPANTEPLVRFVLEKINHGEFVS